MSYDNETPMNDKFLMADGSVRNSNGQTIQSANVNVEGGGFHKLYCYQLRGYYYWTLTTDPEDRVHPYLQASSDGTIISAGSTWDILGRGGTRVPEKDIEF